MGAAGSVQADGLEVHHARAMRKDETHSAPSKSGFVVETIKLGAGFVEQVGNAATVVGKVAQRGVKQVDAVIRKSHVRSFTPQQIAKVRALYGEADKREDGALDRQELRHALHELTGRWLTVSEMDTFWDEVDEDRSGFISFEEFLVTAGPILYPPTAYRLLQDAANQAEELREFGKRSVEDAAYLAADPIVDLVIVRVEDMLVQNLCDIDMPSAIYAAVQRAIELGVQDLRTEVKELAKNNIRKKIKVSEPVVYSNCFVRCVYTVRSYLLYALFPYDRSMWVQIRNPFYVVLKLISIYPPPIQPLFFILQFLLMDKRDEYQLVRFILLFKTSQFVSIGILNTFIGASYYYRADGEPVYFPISILSIALFLAQVVVVWLAFLLLPVSKEKGSYDQHNLDEDLIGVCCGFKRYRGRGGRLPQLFIYDLFCFLLIAAMSLAAYATDGTAKSISLFGDLELVGADPAELQDADRRFAEQLYWCRTLYGVLALPFMLFLFPLAGDLLTHSLPTAYDEWGRTLPKFDAKQLAAVARTRHRQAEVEKSERHLAGVSLFCAPCYHTRNGMRKRKPEPESPERV
ncbi:hypothetical protein T492DRAFT_1079185 [Pavlovales sp. CCMP2436]|nr:hypothetical protein T492DRAFT_1079185 [Pavlovales sp. CCMP2436]